MKKLLIITTLLLSCLFCTAQVRGYKCIYQQKHDLGNIDIGEEAAMFKDAIKGFFENEKSFFTLTFADGKSLFEKNKEMSEESFSMFSKTVYVDLNNNEMISQEDFFGKLFLVSDTVPAYEWNITDETKEINGMICTKAILGDTLKRLEDLGGDIENLEDIDWGKAMQSITSAWFCPEVPIPAGPNAFMGLPGLIVELDVAVEKYVLSSVEVVENMKEIVPPKKGKKVTAQEFRKIQAEKIKEMQNRGGMDFGDGKEFQIVIPNR